MNGNAKSKKADFSFPQALKSFLGYLEGTGKSVHTIKNYKLDLQSFKNYLEGSFLTKPAVLNELTSQDLEGFHTFLKNLGLKTNTRRRMLMTVRKFFQYLNQRNKLSMDVGRRLVTPHKLERIPLTISADDLLSAIRKLPEETHLDLRNKLILWILTETACLVSEVSSLRYEQFNLENAENPKLTFVTKSGSRTLNISPDLVSVLSKLQARAGGAVHLFLGFNKFGALGAPISPRGIEMLVKHLAPKLGFKILTPRTFRHSTIVHWLKHGVEQKEIQTRLGLKSQYAFRAYQTFAKKTKPTTKTTSTSGTNPPES